MPGCFQTRLVFKHGEDLPGFDHLTLVNLDGGDRRRPRVARRRLAQMDDPVPGRNSAQAGNASVTRARSAVRYALLIASRQPIPSRGEILPRQATPRSPAPVRLSDTPSL